VYDRAKYKNRPWSARGPWEKAAVPRGFRVVSLNGRAHRFGARNSEAAARYILARFRASLGGAGKRLSRPAGSHLERKMNSVTWF
jgi:hypothetical protein